MTKGSKILGWPKSLFFFHKMALVVFNFIQTILLGCIVTAVISACIKKPSKLVNFCVAILILKIEENKQQFWHVMLYYFKKGKNTNETQ